MTGGGPKCLVQKSGALWAAESAAALSDALHCVSDLATAKAVCAALLDVPPQTVAGDTSACARSVAFELAGLRSPASLLAVSSTLIV